MNKDKISTNHRLTIVSLLYVLFAFFMLMVVTYAWFSNTNFNKGSLISYVSSVEAEYRYYRYNDTSHSGSSNLTLIDNTASFDGEDLKYQLVPNPTVAHLVDGYVAPGEKFSFAIAITNVGNGTGYLELSFGNVISEDYDLEVNRIQNAFYYEVTKIVSTDDIVESADIKDTPPVTYWSNYFTGDVTTEYDVLKNVPLGYNETDSTTVIFFDIIFDPTIFGENSYGIPYTDSNIYMGQTITINHIYMSISGNEV